MISYIIFRRLSNEIDANSPAADVKSLLPKSKLDEHAHQQTLNWPNLPVKHKIFNSSLCSLKKRCQQRQQTTRECWLLTSLSMMQIVNFYEPFLYLQRRIIQRSVSRYSLTKKNFRDMQLFWRLSLVRYDTWHIEKTGHEKLFWTSGHQNENGVFSKYSLC